MKKAHLSALGSLAALLLATACCWLPAVVAALFGTALGATAFSEEFERFSPLLFALGMGLLACAVWLFFKKRKHRAGQSSALILQSTLTCPNCGFKKTETMPTDACQFFYECENCRTRLRPKPGDCCVFCSYADVKCPPMQQGNGCC